MAGWLDGKVAIITGGGNGIGAAIARKFADEGAKLIINDLGASPDGVGDDEGPAKVMAEEIIAKGGSAQYDGGDISKFETGERLVAKAIDAYGRLDVLVNVAGILRDRMIFNLEEKDWDAVINVHLKGHYNTIRPAAAYWRGQRNPNANYRIINFSSIAGLHGSAGQPNYAAAKMGIVGLTYSTANALSKYGVTTNAISPRAASRLTAIIPDHLRTGNESTEETAGARHIAPMATYLASDRSGWLNGRVVGVRGNSVELYNIPEPIREISSAEDWDLETLAEMAERSFASPAKVKLVAPGFERD
ncbi:SDR family NAD(P)-dependent oxidoreductase [Microbacterium sp. A94]|uniref:SDR family NAD(P)-dependent oxidoreductase n=1 Tax=Microbacterium sp. A94 TaxID=3450717 RepID=UPI003F42FD9E